MKNQKHGVSNWKKWSAFGIGFLAATIGTGWYFKQKKSQYVIQMENENGSLWISEKVIRQLIERNLKPLPQVQEISASIQKTEESLVLKITVPTPRQNHQEIAVFAEMIQQDFMRHIGILLPVQITSVTE